MADVKFKKWQCSLTLNSPCPMCHMLDQSSKLRVHSAPDAHISAAGHTFFGHVRLICAHLFIQLLLLYTRGAKSQVHSFNLGVPEERTEYNPNFEHCRFEK